MALPAEVSRLLESAAEAEAQGNAREARVRYEAAAKLAPDAAVPHLRLGILCHRLRDYPHARQALERAALLAPTIPRSPSGRGAPATRPGIGTGPGPPIAGP